MAVKNLYYSILSDHPEYKYAYDLTSEVGEDGLLRCKVSYMPYRTGAYPAGFQGIEVDGLDRLVEVARGGLSQESIPIRITEPTLTGRFSRWAEVGCCASSAVTAPLSRSRPRAA